MKQELEATQSAAYKLKAEERKLLLQRYAEAPAKIAALWQRVPPPARSWKPSPAEWSIHEVLVHLADTEAQAYVRTRTMLAEPGNTIQAFDQNIWADKLLYTSQDADTCLAVFSLMRSLTAALLSNIPEESWANAALHSESGPMTPEDWLIIYADHDHINQINRIMRAYDNRH